jgi:predicted nucleic acid-binding protein
VITAVDTNVLLDVFTADRTFGSSSRRAIANAFEDGAVMACEVVWAEVAGSFRSADEGRERLDELGVAFAPLDHEVALEAGAIWWGHVRSGGGRDRSMADFLVGTHAWMRADGLLTRDRGFYRGYFRRLRIVDPSANRAP